MPTKTLPTPLFQIEDGPVIAAADQKAAVDFYEERYLRDYEGESVTPVTAQDLEDLGGGLIKALEERCESEAPPFVFATPYE